MPRNKPLLLTVDGTVDPLDRALRAGKATLADFGKAAGDMAAEVQQKLREAASNPAPVVESLQKSLQAQINAARQAANAAIANTGGAVNASSSLAAAEAVEKLALAERNRAEAAIKAVSGDERQAAGLKAIAVSATASASALDDQAAALREQAAILNLVEKEQVDFGAGVEKVTATSGAMRAGFQQAGFQISDFAVQVGGGTSAIRAASQQAPQLIQALAIMGSGAENSTSRFSRFAAFMGGPWGAAITVGVSILGALATSLLDTDDAADQAESQTYDFSRSLDFLVLKADAAQTAIKQLVGETERLLKIEGDFSVQVAKNAETALSQGQTRLSKAQRRVDDLEGARSDPGGFSIYLLQIADAKKELEAAKKFVAEAKTAADNASLGLSQRSVIEARDPNQAKLNRIKEEVGTLETRRRASIDVERLDPRIRNFELRKRDAVYISEAEYQSELKRLEGLREAAEKLQQAAKKPAKTSGTSVADDNALGNTVALLEQLLPGVRITSKTGGKHVKGSDHYAGRAVDFVPAGGINSISFEGMKKLLEDAGVKIRRNASGREQFFGPGHGAAKPGDHDDHFHLGFEGSPSPEAAQRLADRRAEKLKSDQEALQGATLASLEERARLERAGVTDLARLAELDKATVDAGLARKLAQNAKLDLDHADLDALDRANAETEKRAIDEKLRRDLTDKALQVERDSIDAAAQLLELQGQLAVSLKDRKAVAEQLLDLWRKQALAGADQQFNRDGDLGAYLTNQANIGQVYNARQANLYQQFRNPLEVYRDQLKSNVGDMDEALQGVAAHGLQGLEDGLLGLIDGTENVASAFKKMAASIIADLARIAIEKAILAVFAFNKGAVPGRATGDVPGFASGVISGPGTGTSDSILAFHENLGLIRVSNGESIITAEGTRKHRRLLKAINDNTLPAFASGMVGEVAYPTLPSAASLRGGGPAPVQYFDLRGSVVLEELYRTMHQISAAHSGQALAAAPSLAMDELASHNAQRIPV